jgi:hypothetical protein
LAQPHWFASSNLQSPAGCIVLVLVMTECPTCNADPCANPDFCRACCDADRRREIKKGLKTMTKVLKFESAEQ